MPPPSPLRAFGVPRPHFEGKVNTYRRRKLKDVARTLPRAPGVYFFYGFEDRLLYVGKAKVLRERVRSYFAETSVKRPPKLRRLLAEITRLEYEECGCELEALLFERRLIAQRRPAMNWQHNRFEIYPYLLLSDEAFPRLTLTRAEPFAAPVDGDGAPPSWAEAETDEEESEDMPSRTGRRWEASPDQHRWTNAPVETEPYAGELPGLYLGPFTTPRAARWTLEAVRTLFPLRTCDGQIVPDPNNRACFYHDIGRCCAPCIAAAPRETYALLCAELVACLQGGQSPRVQALRDRMQRLALEWRFEEAGKLKEQLQALDLVAARLQRLTRMRETNNVAIVQPARGGAGKTDVTIFLVHGGVVRRHLVTGDWEALRGLIREVYGAPPPATPFTAKTELDEMMVLDRWLKSNGDNACCAWLNDRSSRRWADNARRKLQAWAESAHRD